MNGWAILRADSFDAVEKVLYEHGVDLEPEFATEIVEAAAKPFVAELNEAAEWARNARDFRERQADHLKNKSDIAVNGLRQIKDICAGQRDMLQLGIGDRAKAAIYQDIVLSVSALLERIEAAS